MPVIRSVSSVSRPVTSGEVVGFAGVEAGDLLGVVGELVQDGGDGVGGHGQLQGKAVPSPGIQSAGTWSGMSGSGSGSAG